MIGIETVIGVTATNCGYIKLSVFLSLYNFILGFAFLEQNFGW